MVFSAPIAFNSSTGKFLTKPPSTSTESPMPTGTKMVGKDIVARKAKARFPLSKTTAFPVTASVAMHRKGMGN